jgi:hypothetical protein
VSKEALSHVVAESWIDKFVNAGGATLPVVNCPFKVPWSSIDKTLSALEIPKIISIEMIIIHVLFFTINLTPVFN